MRKKPFEEFVLRFLPSDGDGEILVKLCPYFHGLSHFLLFLPTRSKKPNAELVIVFLRQQVAFPSFSLQFGCQSGSVMAKREKVTCHRKHSHYTCSCVVVVQRTSTMCTLLKPSKLVGDPIVLRNASNLQSHSPAAEVNFGIAI